MGYYKNQVIELEEIHGPDLREIVEWDREHRDVLSDDSRWLILTNERLTNLALRAWKSGDVPKPRPASSHVALHLKRRQLRPAGSQASLLGWSLIAIAFLTAVTVLAVML